MTTPGADTMRVYELGHRLMDAIRMAALDTGVALPDKQIVTSGEAVHDCELVAVTFINLVTGIPDASSGAGFPGSVSGGGFCAPPWSATMQVEIVRCAPVWDVEVVPQSLINDALIPVSMDANVIMRAINNLGATPQNFGDILGSMQFPPPAGGFVVTKAQITATLG